ncbi:MAG: hypothetical protein M3M87_01350 [Thermoproteota archaeon]|nr:hypothetical protein [Thermoproteota archaeon]
MAQKWQGLMYDDWLNANSSCPPRLVVGQDRDQCGLAEVLRSACNTVDRSPIYIELKDLL